MEGESIEKQGLPAGWIRDETGALRRETQHRMGRRCIGWDYKLPGSYEITLTMADRSGAWLGVLETHEQAREHEGDREGAGAYIEPTKLGEVVAGIWRELGVLWPGVEPCELQLMPEHLHGILRVKTPQKHPLGQIIGSFKAKTTSAARELARELASKLASTGGASTGGGMLACLRACSPARLRACSPACLRACSKVKASGRPDSMMRFFGISRNTGANVTT